MRLPSTPRLLLIRSLSVYVSTHPGISREDFESLAKAIVDSQPGIFSVQLAKDNVITHVYPFPSNESVLGLRLLQDLPAEQMPAIRRITESRQTVVAGPVKLLQGGMGLISRSPVIIAHGGKDHGGGAYWGLATMIVDPDVLFREAKLSGLKNIWLVIRGKDGLGERGEVIFGDPAILRQDPVKLDVVMPGGSWQLAAVPVSGWTVSNYVRTAWGLVAVVWLGAGLVLWGLLLWPLRLRTAVARATWTIQTANDDLERKVTERTEDLRNANALLQKEAAERALADQALQASEAKYRRLHESLMDAFALVDMNGRIKECNGAFLTMLGYGPDQVVSLTYEDLTPERWRAFEAGIIEQQVLPKGYSDIYEKEYRRNDGTTFPVEFRTFLLRDDLGNPSGMWAIVRDITERNRAEEERKAHIRFLESLERIDQAIKQATNVEQMLWNIIKTVFSVFDCDRAWPLYPCDPDAPSFRVPVEINRPEYPGAKVLDMDVPMSPAQARNMREAMESDGPVTYTAGTERPISTADQFHVQSQMFVPVYPKLGKPWVFGMHQCSYPRIWTEEEQKLFKEIGCRISDGLSSVLFLRELQENEERFRATFEQAAVGIAHVAPDGRCLRANQRLCDIVGYSREELLQKKFQDITHPNDLDADLEYVSQVLAGQLQTYNMEKRFFRKDGSIVWIDLTVSIVRHASGDLAYIISVIEDITKRKKAEEEKEMLEAQLSQAQKLKAVGTLAGGIAHDFNNILAPIIGYTEMALSDTPQFTPIRHGLEQILIAAMRARDLVKQILAFGRSGKEQQKIPVEISSIVKEALKLLRASLPSSIEIRQNIENGVASADATQIHQVLINLCTNAAHAMGDRGILEVSLSHVDLSESDLADQSIVDLKPGPYLKLCVSDTGAGMDKVTLEHIFDPYFTTREVGKGSGLGLAVVHGIVKRHDGAVTVQSEPLKGSTFCIYLPAAEADAGVVVETEQELPTGTERILLIDDE